MTYSRRVVSEALGTALLLAAVVGSGIMAERLAGGNVALTLLANTLATGAALVALILAFGPISGAHLNPVVSLVEAWRGNTCWREIPGYLTAQFIGAVVGVAAAHAMFAEPIVQFSEKVRAGLPQGFSEFVATFGLVAVVLGCMRLRPAAVPFAVAAYITSAFWFTASTSFANPAVTVARAFTNSFAGIRATDVPTFLLAQVLGAAAAASLFRWFEAGAVQKS